MSHSAFFISPHTANARGTSRNYTPSLYDVVQQAIVEVSQLDNTPNAHQEIKKQLEAFAIRLYVQSDCVYEIQQLCEKLTRSDRKSPLAQVMLTLKNHCDLNIQAAKERAEQISKELASSAQLSAAKRKN